MSRKFVRRYGAFLLVAGLLMPGCNLLTGTDSSKGKNPPSDTTTVETLVQERFNEQPAGTGVVVAVVEGDNRRTFARGVLREGGPSVNEQTLFEIASVTKTFTALALVDRVEAGTVQLSTRAATMVPDSVDVPMKDGTPITLGDLVSHTAGLPRLPPNLDEQSEFDDPADPYAGYTVAELHRGIEQTRLADRPGSAYSYSNFGYGLLGHLLARQADTTYGAVIARRVTGPLGLDDTRVELSDDQAGRLATGHRPSGETVPHWHFRESMAGAGALRSSLRDMMTYVEAQLGRADAAPSLRRAIERSQTILHERTDQRALAYGWHVRNRTDDPVFWHNGGTYGFRAFVGFSPEHDAGVVVLANVDQSVTEMGLRVLDRVVANEAGTP